MTHVDVFFTTAGGVLWLGVWVCMIGEIIHRLEPSVFSGMLIFVCAALCVAIPAAIFFGH